MFDSFEKFLKNISSLDIKTIENAFPTVIWEPTIGGLFSYDIGSGWKFFKECPANCCWKSIIDELPKQLKTLIGDNNYCGYQTITFKKRTSALQTSFGSLVIDAGQGVFNCESDNGTVLPNETWRIGIASSSNYYPTDVLIEKGKQFAFIWGLSNDDLLYIKNLINDDSITFIRVSLNNDNGFYYLESFEEDSLIWDSFVPTKNPDKNRHLIGGLSFLLNNSLQTVKKENLKKTGMIVFTPSTVNVDNGSDAVSSVFVCLDDNLKDNAFKILNGFSLITRSYGLAVERWLLALQTRKEVSEQATQTAIGSIMSRNGSHNIGSHVLSSLTHHVGTMPDDRMLYQYIQHRMDYIATATTDFPQWTTPTMFVGGLMKNFYSQKHLLDYISRSEGLRAYKFQERNLDDAARMNQHGTIRIFIRRFYKLNNTQKSDLPEKHRYLTYDINGQAWSVYFFFGEKDKMFRQKFSSDKRVRYEVSESGGTNKFLEYDHKFFPDWDQDVRVAIPGGIVGQHAFYTIIENTIRNAAKHGWASESNFSEKDLEIFIDFEEDKDNGNIIFTIGDNVSDVFGAAKTFWDKFFSDFSCSDQEKPFDHWFQFLTDEELEDIALEYSSNCDDDKRQNDYLLNYLKNKREIILSNPEISKLGTEDLEKLKPEIGEIAQLLLRSFSMPLETKDAKYLEEFLNGDNEDEGGLPLIYRLQRIYLLNELRKFNVGCFFEPKGNCEKGWLIKEGTDIISAIHSALLEGFDELLADDSKFTELCKNCQKWDNVLNLFKSKNDKTKDEYKKELEENLQKVLSKSQLDVILSTIDDFQSIVYDKSKIKSQCQYVIYKFLSSRISNKWEYYKFLTTNLPNNHKWGFGNRLILPLHHDQQRKLAQSFINSDGKLRKENWGLAEMKISAGYLAQRDISEIGGLEDKGNKIVVPVVMPGTCHHADNPNNCLSCSSKSKIDCFKDDDCPLKNRRFHLGYRFQIAKPKDILVILDSGQNLPTTLGKNWEKVISLFGGEGIDFVYAKECFEKDKIIKFDCYQIPIKDDPIIKKLNYRYVLLPDSILSKWNQLEKIIRSQFCFRTIPLKDVIFLTEKDGEKNLNQIIKDNWNEGYRTIIVDQFNDGEDKSDDGTKGADVLRKAVFSAWIKKLTDDSIGIKNDSVKLIVNVEGNESDRAHGLVTTEDLLHTLFVECYHAALISFLKNPPGSLELSDTTKHLINLLALIKVDKIEPPQCDYGHGDDYGAKEFIRAQLTKYCDDLKSELLLSNEFIDALKAIGECAVDSIIARKIEDIDSNFEKSIARRIFRGGQDEDEMIRHGCHALLVFLSTIDKSKLDNMLDAFHDGSDKYNDSSNNNLYRSGRHLFEDNIKAVINACSSPDADAFDALIESLNSMFLASDVYLRKYEERIATLPEAYKHDGGKIRNEHVQSTVFSVQEITDELLTGKIDSKPGLSKNKQYPTIIKYSRHDKAKPQNAIYAEALSGSQSYLNALSRLVYPNGKDKHFMRYAAVARLLENAFLRILIIDERVMNFVEEHSNDEMIKRFINMGIWVADIRKSQPAKHREKIFDELFPIEYKDSDLVNNELQEQAIKLSDNNRQFDILIIHQGIIDKWWAKHDKDKVKAVLDDIRKTCNIPWVVVTTGRGRPENIPDDEKVIPFSVIESSLFRLYPEKLILVNTIMNLLPYGKQE